MSKNKTIEIDREFSELILNPAGIPCKNENSEQLRKEHNRWESEAKKIPSKEVSKLKYWQKVSSCSAL